MKSKKLNHCLEIIQINKEVSASLLNMIRNSKLLSAESKNRLTKSRNILQETNITMQQTNDRNSGKPPVDLAFGPQRLSKLINNPVRNN